MKQCTIPACEKPHYARQWCEMHYARWRRYGDPMRGLRTVDERFWAKVDADGDCWIWTGATSWGYGHFCPKPRKWIGAHRWAWESLVGPIPAGMTIDHLCRNPPCVNPDHLEVVTSGENTRRGKGAWIAAERARARTHCGNGHVRNTENTYRAADGRAYCRVCDRLRMRRLRAAIKDDSLVP